MSDGTARKHISSRRKSSHHSSDLQYAQDTSSSSYYTTSTVRSARSYPVVAQRTLQPPQTFAQWLNCMVGDMVKALPLAGPNQSVRYVDYDEIERRRERRRRRESGRTH